MGCKDCDSKTIVKDGKTHTFENEKNDNVNVRKKRKKLTKEEKVSRRKNRTPAQQKAINDRMAKLRSMRKKKKKEKNFILNIT